MMPDRNSGPYDSCGQKAWSCSPRSNGVPDWDTASRTTKINDTVHRVMRCTRISWYRASRRPPLVVLQETTEQLMANDLVQPERLKRRRRRKTGCDGHIAQTLMRALRW